MKNSSKSQPKKSKSKLEKFDTFAWIFGFLIGSFLLLMIAGDPKAFILPFILVIVVIISKTFLYKHKKDNKNEK